MLCDGAPAHREDIPGVILAPVIKSTPPAIKHYKDLIALYFSNSCRADEVRVFLVHSFQLHARLKVVLGRPWRFLKMDATLRHVINKYIATKTILHFLYDKLMLEGQHTFLKAAAGAISAPFNVLNRNMGHEEAFMRNPGERAEKG